MYKLLLPSLCAVFLVNSNVAVAQPTASENLITWPSDGWYQVQRAKRQGSLNINWNLCNTNNDGTSCVVPAGEYRVNRQGGNPWRTLEFYYLTVPDGGMSSADGDGSGSSGSGSGSSSGGSGSSGNVSTPTVSGNKILLPSGSFYQVQRTSRQGQNQVDWNVCNSNSHGTSCTVPSGTYHVNRQGGNPWRKLQEYDPLIVGANNTGGESTDNGDTGSGNDTGSGSTGGSDSGSGSSGGGDTGSGSSGDTDTSPDSSSGWRQVWRDDFNGSSVSSNFYVPNWTSASRDAVNNRDACYQSGGKLNLTIKQVGNRRHACFLISNKNDFGPGDNTTLKIEYRANMSQVKARGAWFAGWMYVNGLNSSGVPFGEDGDLSNGSEYDVFEYMPTNQDAFNTAIHDGKKFKQWNYPLGTYGIDLKKNEYHTFALEWNKNCVAFFIDGRKVFHNSTHVSKAKRHNIMLTMEAQTGTQWGFWNVGNFANNLASNPARGQIDWVKVSEKNSVSSANCS